MSTNKTLKRPVRILHLFDKAISKVDFIKQMTGEGIARRVNNQKVHKSHHGKPTELFGNTNSTKPSNAWIWQTKE